MVISYDFMTYFANFANFERNSNLTNEDQWIVPKNGRFVFHAWGGPYIEPKSIIGFHKCTT